MSNPRGAPKGAKKEVIDIVIHPDGRIENEASGFTGGACTKELDALMKNVGKTTSTKRKGEFFQKDQRVEVVRGK